VKNAVNQLFTAMKNSDSAQLMASFADGAILQTIATDKDGKELVRNDELKDFGQNDRQIAKRRSRRTDPVRCYPDRCPLAIVWAPYSFYYNGKLNHCGAILPAFFA